MAGFRRISETLSKPLSSHPNPHILPQQTTGNTERQRLMVQDDESRWWAKNPNNDKWIYYDGSAWVPGTPPGYQEATPELTDSPTQTSSFWILVAALAGIVLAGIVFGSALVSNVPSGPGLDEQGELENRVGELENRVDRVEGPWRMGY